MADGIADQCFDLFIREVAGHAFLRFDGSHASTCAADAAQDRVRAS
jgi:hypothetical protein